MYRLIAWIAPFLLLQFLVLDCYAQTPADTYVTSDTLCVNQNLAIISTPAANSYEWDFCSGDLGLAPMASTLLTLPGDVTVGLDVAYDGVNYYGLASSRSTNELYRLSFGNQLTNLPTVEKVTLSVNPFNGPEGIKLYQQGSNWYALVCNLFGSTITRIKFGSSLANTPANADLSQMAVPAGLLDFPRNVDVVSNQGMVYGLVANFNTNQVTILNFGSSIANNSITGANISIGGSNGLFDVKAVRDQNQWYALCTATTSGTVHRISFGSSISANGVSINTVANVESAFKIALAREQNKTFAFIGTNNGSLHRLNFGSSLGGQHQIVNLGKLETLASTSGLSLLKQADSRWVGLALDNNSRNLGRILFPNSCWANIATSSEETPINISYSKPGKYFIDLTVSDVNGNSSVVTDSVMVLSAVAPSILFTTDSQCTGAATQFSGVSDGVVTSWQWDFGDNAIGSGQNVSHQYVSEGTHRVVLNVKGDGSCTNQYTKMVTIYNNNKPTPRFSIPALVCSNSSVQFTDQSVPVVNETIRRWRWNFGDGTTSAEPNPFHEYAQSGVYTISLSVAGLSGCDSTLSKTITVQSGTQVNFNFSKVCIGDATAFNNITAPEGAWTWNFGEPTSVNNTSTLKNPTHTYAAPGLYTVSLSATTPNGCVVTRRKQIRIGVTPVLDFIYFRVCVAAPVEFTVSSLTSDTLTKGLTWNFGDPGSQDNLSTEDSPTHVFTRPGTYSVTLTLTTALGCQESITKQIEVKPSARPDFSLTSTCATQPLVFTNSTEAVNNDPISRYTWNFGDNTPVVSVKDPVHTFANPGTYNITLTVYGSQSGCESVVTRSVQITALPDVIFSAVPTCNGYTFQFTDNTSLPPGETARSWEWNFGGQGSSLVQNPQFNFNQPGSYIVSLKLTLVSGCSRTLTRNVTVDPLPQADFRFSPDYRAAPMEVTFVNDSRRATRYQWDFGDTSFSTETAPHHTYTAIGEYTVTLLAYNGVGCADTIRKTVHVKVPLADVRVRSIALDNTGGLYTVIANILNTGTSPLSSLELLMTGGNAFGLQEKWTGSIQPNQSFVYPFKARIVKDYVGELPYVCVLLQKPNGSPDPTPEDNRSCASLLETFSVLPAYPSPSPGGKITIPCILPEAAEVRLQVYDATGRNVYTYSQMNTRSGFNELSADLAGLSNGLYILQIIYQGKSQSQKWFRQR